MFQLLHLYMTTGKTIAWTICIFVSKVMSLLFKMLSRFVIVFLPRSKCLLISWLQSLSAVILEPKKIKSSIVSTFPPSIYHEVIGRDAMILVLWSWFLTQPFHSPLSPSSRGSLVSSLLSAIKVVSPAHLTLLIFLLSILIPACESSSLAFHMMYSAYPCHNFEPVCCSMSGFNCGFLTCIQVFLETGKVVWYSHLLKSFPQFFCDPHRQRLYSIVSEAEVHVIQQMLAIWSLIPLTFLNPACTFGSSWFTYSWSLAWRMLSITLLVSEMNSVVR